MTARFLAGAGAWLLGAGAATGGCLLAVSALGQGLAPAPSQQLTVAAVNRALASEAEAARPAALMPPVRSSATPLAPRARKSTAAPSLPPSSPAPQPSTADFTSGGGSVVAGCQSAGAYLVSWIPAQGYAARWWIRGPAATAEVTFAGSRKVVTMTISCSGGVPSASTTVTHGDE